MINSVILKSQGENMKTESIKTENKKRIINAIALYVLALVVFVATVIFLYMNKAKMNNVEIAIIVVIVIVIFGGAFIFLVQRLTKTGHYMCTKCEHKFVPSTKKYLITLKIGGSCYLECPACKKKSWCKKVL